MAKPFIEYRHFDGDHDLFSFLQKANDTGLLVILRAGPYVCGEWDLVSVG